jgi:hypothetical protein
VLILVRVSGTSKLRLGLLDENTERNFFLNHFFDDRSLLGASTWSEADSDDNRWESRSGIDEARALARAGHLLSTLDDDFLIPASGSLIATFLYLRYSGKL